MAELTDETRAKLEKSKNIWIASVRPDGRPHLVPVWYVWYAQKIYICIDPSSVKATNFRDNPRVTAALEDGSNPIICEGQASPVFSPWPKEVISGFMVKYEWDITQESQYTYLIEIVPNKWLTW